jgi:hypothetical protein
MPELRILVRLALALLALACATAGCLDLDGYHPESDAGPDAESAADGADADAPSD